MSEIQFPENIEEAIRRNHSIAPEEVIVAEGPAIIVEDGPPSFRTRIMEAFDVALAFADRLEPEYAKIERDRLSRSNVHGSKIEGIWNFDDVAHMLSSAKNWREVQANLKDKTIEVIQGELAPEYAKRAFTAYATVREINVKYGFDGLNSIMAKAGYQREDDYYFATLLRVQTNVITVQLKKVNQGNDFELIHQWFAGPEISSILLVDHGDMIVRCGVTVPVLREARQHRPAHGKSFNRSAA